MKEVLSLENTGLVNVSVEGLIGMKCKFHGDMYPGNFKIADVRISIDTSDWNIYFGLIVKPTKNNELTKEQITSINSTIFPAYDIYIIN